MLFNYAKFKGYDLTAIGDLTKFPDGGDVAGWAETAMQWANGNELINGHADTGKLDPLGTTVRAQAASILTKFHQTFVNPQDTVQGRPRQFAGAFLSAHTGFV